MIPENYTTCNSCEPALSFTSIVGVSVSIVFLTISTFIFIYEEMYVWNFFIL